MAQQDPYTEEEIKTDPKVLTEITYLFQDNEYYKEVFPEQLNTADPPKLLQFLKEAMQHTSLLRDSDKTKRGAELVKQLISKFARTMVKMMLFFPHWDKTRDAFIGNLTKLEKMFIAVMDWIGPIPFIKEKEAKKKEKQEKEEKKRQEEAKQKDQLKPEEKKTTTKEGIPNIVSNPYTKARPRKVKKRRKS